MSARPLDAKKELECPAAEVIAQLATGIRAAPWP